MNIGYEAKRVFHNRTGLGNYGRDLIRVLSRYHPENTYYLYNPKPADRPLFVPAAPQVMERLPQTGFGRRFHSLWRQRLVVRDLRLDGIQLFHGLSGELPTGLRQRGIRSVVTIHDLIFMRYPELYPWIDRTIYRRKFRHAAHGSDRIVAISEQTKRDIVHFLQVDDTKIDVVYQGCHPAFKQRYTDAEKGDVRMRYALPQDFILNVGTIEKRKNALAIAKAITRLDVPLVIAGRPTAYQRELEAYIARHGLAKRIIFIHGADTADLAKLYQMAHLFVYPSLFEGFGIPIVEALFSGVPVITTDGGCFPEAGGSHSHYVDPQDTEALAVAISGLLDNRSLRGTMIAHGQEFAQRFDDERIANHMATLYDSLLP